VTGQIIGDNLNNIILEGNRHFKEKKKRDCLKELMSPQLTVRARILEICVEEYMNLRRVTNLEVT
jgi:hypothetical protein